MCVVHDKGEQQETGKGHMHGRDVHREPQGGCVGVLWAGGYGRMRVAHVAGGGKWEGKRKSFSYNVCHPTHKTEHMASGELWANSLATEHHMMEVQTTW